LPGLLALAIGVSACGQTTSTSGFSGESKAVAQRISDFQSHATTANERKICAEDVAASVKARLQASGASCQQAFKNQLSEIDTLSLTVQAVQISGTTATATVKSTWSGRTTLTKVSLVKEGSHWKIASLG
jgi:hypothetical protein